MTSLFLHDFHGLNVSVSFVQFENIRFMQTCDKLTNFWLMYKVRFAGGSVASELQLIDNLSPIKYLQNKTVNPPTLFVSTSTPVLGSVNLRSVLGDDHDQEVAVLAVRGEHRPLLAHLAPVAARAVQGQRGEGHVVHARLGELHTDPRQVVHGDWTRLAREVADMKDKRYIYVVFILSSVQ